MAQPSKWNTATDVKSYQLKNVDQFVKKSPYFKDARKPDYATKLQNDKNTTQNMTRKLPFKPRYNQQYNSNRRVEKVNLIEESDYIDVTSDTLEDIETNHLMLIDIFEENNWSSENIDEFLAIQTCTNCDEDGHILENCPTLMNNGKFRQQCTLCHAVGSSRSNCQNCPKN